MENFQNKHLHFFVVLLLFTIAGQSQKQGNTWYFGDKAGVNFNVNPPVALTNGQTDFVLPIGWNEASSTISDSSGALLFYSNSVLVWNRFQTVMPNGSGLMGHRSSTGGCIIVPQPGSQNLFYVFTLGAEENSYVGGFRYSIVDMCLDSGKGDVIPASKNTFLEDSMTEKMVSIRHANNTDYWIVVHKMTTRKYYSFLLTSAGLTNTVVSVTDTIHYVGVGQMKASPNGLKIAVATPNGYGLGNGFHQGFTSLMDFNPATGVVSNAVALPPSQLKTDYGVCFSPDNSKLYFSCVGHGEIYQYNLSAGPLAAVIASKTWIIPSGPDSWRQLANGPDGKVYISRTMKSYLSVISSPNNTGLACNYVDSAIYMQGKKTSFGLPNLIAGFKYNNLVPVGPLLSISPNVSICPGNTATLTVTGASQYTWSNNSTATTVVVSPTITTNYSVVGSQGGCASSASVYVYMLPAPAMSVTSNVTICMGESTTITASGAGNYLWSNNATSSAIAVAPFIPTTYTVFGTNSNMQCAAIQIVSVTVKPCTNISKYDEQSEWTIYPNPANNYIVIHAKKKQQIQVFNGLGQAIANFELRPGENHFDIAHFAKGIYFLRDVAAHLNATKIIKE